MLSHKAQLILFLLMLQEIGSPNPVSTNALLKIGCA